MSTHTINELLLKAHSVSKSFGDKKVLRDINFEIHNIVRPDKFQGQVVSMIGRSGVGKTQLFKILAGLMEPTSGAVTIDVDQHHVRPGEVGIIPQNYILFNHRTVYQNLKIGLDFSGQKLTQKQEEDIIHEYAEKFHLREHLKKYPQMLSGGQRQRVSIIQQVLTGNKFILLDEPFSGLDMLMIDVVIELLLNVSTINEYNTLIIVSHDIENALAISDTAFVLANQPNVEGATITEKIDLIKLGFAWNPDIRTNAHFQELVGSIKHKI
jgi:ABC-type nitrate/sulfonate/bicarbonate transport system ATPase subunit